VNLLQQNELTEWEWDAEGQDQEELKQRFEINGLDSLSWAFRKLAAIQVKEEDIISTAKKERDRIDYWELEQKQALKQDKEFFEGLIKQYHAKVLADDSKAKTLSTPWGKSKATASKAQPDKADEEAILKHVQENDMRDFIKESLKWGDLKKTLKVVTVGEEQFVVDENGQMVPGAVVKAASISFSVKPELS
jgi:excinuclease UvrABC ATPase subunit